MQNHVQNITFNKLLDLFQYIFNILQKFRIIKFIRLAVLKSCAYIYNYLKNGVQ